MTIRDFLERVRSGFRKGSPLPDSTIADLIRALEKTREDECGCDDVYSLLDQYAERHFRGEDAARLMPLLKQHMSICNECCEEFEALLHVLEASSDQGGGQHSPPG